ncbi:MULTISPECIES: hypothetical protein [Rhodococcus]|uniref:Uncharacterized protein n=1 Tax=Rhodococcus opacus RKJ300 = JCM 13270 TaxID=1165867 RepID=I0WSD8_RHOOP|nr:MULTISPECIES: hypothetical protein [Rhodococcus]EID79304.1 hypothetical protein W59_14051 [Rhodococcus opacus RKJ300 = JCM 13270]QQZ19761.1 hypothetical protein GO592_42730 [Rhodococcus sp. 21391]
MLAASEQLEQAARRTTAESFSSWPATLPWFGVLAAHDKSVRVLPRGHQLTGQLALPFTMVTYTFGGLYLLFGG